MQYTYEYIHLKSLKYVLISSTHIICLYMFIYVYTGVGKCPILGILDITL